MSLLAAATSENSRTKTPRINHPVGSDSSAFRAARGGPVAFSSQPHRGAAGDRSPRVRPRVLARSLEGFAMSSRISFASRLLVLAGLTLGMLTAAGTVADAQVPILYYDFENNATRSLF